MFFCIFFLLIHVKSGTITFKTKIYLKVLENFSEIFMLTDTFSHSK